LISVFNNHTFLPLLCLTTN